MNHSQTLVKKKKRRNAVLQERGKERARAGVEKMNKASFEFQIGSMIIFPLLPVY